MISFLTSFLPKGAQNTLASLALAALSLYVSSEMFLSYNSHLHNRGCQSTNAMKEPGSIAICWRAVQHKSFPRSSLRGIHRWVWDLESDLPSPNTFTASHLLSGTVCSVLTWLQAPPGVAACTRQKLLSPQTFKKQTSGVFKCPVLKSLHHHFIWIS